MEARNEAQAIYIKVDGIMLEEPVPATPVPRMKWARIREEYPLECEACGSPHWLDTSLSSSVWNQIATPGDVLCMLCIEDRLEAAGLEAECEFYYAGRALKSRLYGGQSAEGNVEGAWFGTRIQELWQVLKRMRRRG